MSERKVRVYQWTVTGMREVVRDPFGMQQYVRAEVMRALDARDAEIARLSLALDADLQRAIDWRAAAKGEDDGLRMGAGVPDPAGDRAADVREAEMSNDITSRLGSYNPPDRTVGAQRQMAQDIADAADALDAKDAEIERLTQELAEAELRTVCNRLQAERDGLRSRLADAFACLQAIRRASWLTPEPRARVEMEIDYRKLRDALNAVAEEKP